MMTRTALIVFGLLLLAPAAHAQVSGLEGSRFSQAAYYHYAEPDDITILVNVWGSVRNPGLYEVPRGTSLSKLFSLAGGPAMGTHREGQERKLTVRLSRKRDGGRHIIFEETMENEVIVFEENPVLRDGDVLTAETYVENAFTWRTALSLVGTAASLATTVIILLTRGGSQGSAP